MRKLSLVVVIGLFLPAALCAQAPASGGAAPATAGAPAATGAGRVISRPAEGDYENAEGKKAQEKFMAEFNKKQQEFDIQTEGFSRSANETSERRQGDE